MYRSCLRVLLFATFAFLGLADSSSSKARDIVHLSGYSAGTIVVKTSQRRLYYFLSDDHVTSLLESMRTHLAEGAAR